MRVKRIVFAFFTSVFTLCGCAASMRESNMKYAAEGKLPALQAFAGADDLKQEIKKQPFLANTAFYIQASILRGNHDVSAAMRMEQELARYSRSFRKKVEEKLAEEKRRKEEEEAKRRKRQMASQAGVESDENGTFSLKTTTYGVDCYGCVQSGGQGATANGVRLDMNKGVQLPSGQWQEGIRYGNYYVIAADPDIPLCSILRISDHGLSGSGISKDRPFEAIVLDRGGAIYGNHVDLYIGSERSNAVRQVSTANPRAEFIRVGGQKNGSCPL